MTDLRFNAERHEYHLGKRKVPGVTAALNPYNDFEHVDPETLRIAADFGQHVHQAVDLFNRNMLDRASLGPAVAAYLAGWERFLDESGFVVVLSEERVYHPKIGYAGTLDAIGNFPHHKELSLVDVKTSAAMPRTVGPQTAAYSEAWAVTHRRRRLKRYCCHIQANAYKLHPLTDVRDFDIFKAALTLHRWQTGE